VVAIKVLCDAAKAWNVWTEMRSASTKVSGETGWGSDWGGSSKSGKVRFGSGGPNGDVRGDAKSISLGEMWPSDSWGTEL
jgi:hypothetical protein